MDDAEDEQEVDIIANEEDEELTDVSVASSESEDEPMKVNGHSNGRAVMKRKRRVSQPSRGRNKRARPSAAPSTRPMVANSNGLTRHARTSRKAGMYREAETDTDSEEEITSTISSRGRVRRLRSGLFNSLR